MTDSRHLDPEPDLLLVLIQRAREFGPMDTDERAQQFDALIRAELGGLRVRIAKRRKHLSDEQRSRIARQALDSSASDHDLAEQNGISRRSLYRFIKRGTDR